MTPRAARTGAALILASALIWASVVLIGAAPALADHGLAIDNPRAISVSPRLVVHASTDATSNRVLAMAETSWARLRPLFRAAPPEPIVIVVIEDREEYDRIQPAPMTRGFATYGGNRIYLRGDGLDQEVVTHEMVHIFLGKNVRRGLDVPDWFNEGLAQYLSEADPHALALSRRAFKDGLLGLVGLAGVDALDGPDRELATIEGSGIVRFLVDRYGEASLLEFIEELGETDAFGRALVDTFGRTDVELSEEWLAYADAEYGLFSLVVLEAVGTLALGILAAAAATLTLVTTVRRRRARSPSDLTDFEIAAAESEEARSAGAAEDHGSLLL